MECCNSNDDKGLAGEFKIPKFSTKKNSFLVFLYSFCFLGLAQGAGIQATGLLLYVQVFKLNLIFLTAIQILAGAVFNFSTIMVGIKSDLLKSKYGRRKPLVFAGIICVSFANFFGTFIPCGDSCSAGFVAAWFLLITIVSNIGASLLALPYSAWLIESTVDEDDYMFITSVCGKVPQFLGFLLSGVSIFLVGDLVQYLTAICTTLGLISAVLLIAFVPNNALRKVEKQPPLIPSMRTCFKTKEFQRVFFNEAMVGTAVALNSDCAQIFIILMVASTQQMYTNLIVFSTITNIVLGLPLMLIVIYYFVEKYDKIKIYQFLTKLICVVSVCVFFLSMIPGNIGPLFFYFLSVFLGVIYFPISFLQSLFVRDLIQFDTFTTGLNRQAMYMLCISLPAGLIAGFVATLPTIIIGFTGYHAIEPSLLDSSTMSPSLSPSIMPTMQPTVPIALPITDYYAYNDGTIWQSRIYSTLIVATVGYFGYKFLENYPLTRDVSVKILEVNASRLATQIKIEAEAEERGDDLDEVVTRGTMDVSIADDTEGMRMQHLSPLEISALCTSPMDNSGRNTRLNEIRSNSIFTIIFGFVNSILFLYAILNMLLSQDSIFTTLCALLFQVNVLMSLYEYLRLQAINELNVLSFDSLKAQALTAYNANLKYSETLDELISRNGIKEVMDDIRHTLAGNDDSEFVLAEVLYLPGYKRTYSFCGICFIFSFLVGFFYV